MTDYIEREAAKEAAWENIINNVVEEQGMYGYLVNLVDKVFDAIPAADVRPVVHGTWINRQKEPKHRAWYTCSLCKGQFDYTWHFCPNCGAKMMKGV